MKILQQKLARDLRDLRAQVLTLAILVICGVSVLVSSWSAYRSLQAGQKEFYEKYNFADIFADFERAPASLLEKVRSVPGVEIAEGRIVEDAILEVPNQKEPAMGRFVSWDKESFLNKIYLVEGRYPEGKSVVEVIVHQSFAKAHKLRPGNQVTAFFKGQKTRVSIAGVGISPEYIYSLSPVATLPDDQHFGVFWMPHEALEARAHLQGAYSNLIIKVSQSASVRAVQSALDLLIKPFGSLGSYDRTKQMSHVFIDNEISEQKSIAVIIPLIFVLVGAFILNVVLSRLIRLQRSQICILKGLGYSSFQLAFYYWKLITIVLVLGVLPAFGLGGMIGSWYTDLYALYFHFPKLVFTLTVDSWWFGLMVGFLPGWISSAHSLLEVFRISPAEGMRPPSPPRFHHTALEKMGVLRSHSILDLMILRDLFFHPLRSIAAILGIAAAIAIMVNGAFWMDVIDFMMKRQFTEVDREDVEVRFVMPRPRDVLNELSRFSGIYLVEGSRNVAVRMVFKNVVKETQLIAFEGESQLRRILDSGGRAIHLNEGSAVLSTYFKKKYGIEVGDRLRFEVMLGKQPTFELPVSNFADDILGASVYVSPKTLRSRLQEEAVIDTAYFKVDKNRLNEIYVKLMETPMVGAVSVKGLFVQSFKKNFAEMIVVFTEILIGFATAISGSVLFNISRITLSEKSWEFASLRILGFDVGTVYNLLFVQIGVQVLLGLGPGLLLGYWLSFLSTFWIQADIFIFPLVVEASTYAGAVFVIFLTFLISGSFLHRKVDRLSMLEALKARE